MAKQYHMRAWDGSSFVSWAVIGSPDLTGEYYPGGSSGLTNITINKVDDSKIDNKIQSYNSTDGYVLHINDIDWLKPTRTSSDSDSATDPISVPTKNVGLAIVRGTADGSTPRSYASLHWDEVQGTFALGFTDNELESFTSSKPLITGHLSVVEGDEDGYLSIERNSNNPSSTGAVRLPNNETIAFRNNADSADINGLTVNSSDEVLLNDIVYIKTNYISFDSSVSAPSISQKLNISGAGTDLSISAQSTVSASNNGGNLLLSSGNAGAGGVDGWIDLQLGGSTTFKVETGLITSTIPDYKIYRLAGDSSFFIEDNNDVNFDGYSLTIHAQNVVDGYGGNLILQSGVGNNSLIDDGYLDFRIGDTQVGQFFSDSGNSTYQAFTNLFEIDGELKFNNKLNRNVAYINNSKTIADSDGYYYIVIDSSNNPSITVSLPASPDEGDVYEFKDSGSANSVNSWVLSGNGKNIDGEASINIGIDAPYNQDYASLTVTYVSGDIDEWLIN